MKLAFLIYAWFPHGGQQRDMLRLARECRVRGHGVTVYAMAWHGPEPEGLRLRLVPARGLSRLGRYRSYTALLQQELAREPADLVLGFNKMPLLDAYFAADSCFAEKALGQRGAWYRLSSRFRHFRAYEQAVFGPASATVSLLLSERQREEYLRHYPGCADRVRLLPPGLAADRKAARRDAATRQACRGELGLGTNERLLLQVGSGFRIKGVDRSLRALASLPEEVRENCRYLLIGRGRATGPRRLARRLGVAHRVHILPGRDDIDRFYQAADLLLHPAWSESAGHVLLEALAAGLPVLTTASCGYAVHVSRAGAGEVCGEPFAQRELNRRLGAMLGQLGSAPWSGNGLRYGREEELGRMPEAAVDILEQLGGITGGQPKRP